MIVKDILNILANCPVEASVSIAINDGLKTDILPASQVQLLVNTVEGRKIHTLIIIHNEKDGKQ